MSAPTGTADEISKLSVTELTHAYIASVQAGEATEHVGRKNRLSDHRSKIIHELKARGEVHRVLEQLTGHSDANVQSSARSYLAWLAKPPSEQPQRQQPKGEFWPKIIWQCDHPPPPALSRDEIGERLRRSVPEACDRLMDLLLPAVGLWPQRRTEVTATASRFGGAPLAPPGWQWPVANEEPLLFVGQINCGELRGLPEAGLLPSSGLLAFFGDHDAVTGCFPFDDHNVFYWPEADRLVPAKSAVEPIETYPSCALVPRPFLDLPHPDSRTVRNLGLNEQQRRSYFDVWLEILRHDIPRDCVWYAGFSKLLGWPDLVQSDLQRFETEDDARLLLQVDSYCNGEEMHGWGPGGSLYYLLPERCLLAHDFEGCELEGQFT